MHWLARAGLLTTGLGMASWLMPCATLHAQPPRRGDAPARAAAPELVRWEAFARSTEGRPLEIAQFGSGPRQILVLGSLSGDDAVGRWMAERLAAHLARFPRRLDEATVVIVRDGNPDGRARRSSGNAHNIELDQNFPTGDWRKIQAGDRYTSGITPLTEPETRALTELIKDVRPDRVILLADGAGKGSVACVGSDELARRVSVETGIPIVSADSLATSGSMAAWTGRDRGITTVLLHLPPRTGGGDPWNEGKRNIMMAMAADDGRQVPPAVSADPTTGQPPSAPPPAVDPNTADALVAAPNRPHVPALTAGQTTVTARPLHAAAVPPFVDSPVAGQAGGVDPREKAISAEALRTLPPRVSVKRPSGVVPAAMPAETAQGAESAKSIGPTPALQVPPTAISPDAIGAPRRPLGNAGRATPVPRRGGLAAGGNSITSKKPAVKEGSPSKVQRLPAADDNHGPIRLPQEPIPLYPSTGL